MDILTPRLRLLPLGEDDIEVLIALHADPDVMRGSTGVAAGRTRAASEEWMRRTLNVSGTDLWETFRVNDRATGTFLGRCGLRPQAGSSETELAYAFVRDAWGRGIASEAASAVVQHGFDGGLTRVVACVLASNPASVRVLEKMGMERVGEETTPNGWLIRFEMRSSGRRLPGDRWGTP